MREKKFTPGPWYVINQEKKDVISISTDQLKTDIDNEIDPYEFKDLTVAGIWSQTDEAQASANLISSAPELLEALENALFLVELKFGNTDDTGSAVIEQSKAAIAKAYGE